MAAQLVQEIFWLLASMICKPLIPPSPRSGILLKTVGELRMALLPMITKKHGGYAGLAIHGRRAKTHERTLRRNKVLSLDAADGTEAAASVCNSDNPAAIFEMMERHCRLCCALNSLPEDEYAELRHLNSERQRLMKQINRANNTLIALLDEFFPEYATVWGNVTCPTSLELLKTYTFPSDIKAVEQEMLLADIKRVSNGTEGVKLMEKMLKMAGRSIGVTEGRKSVRLRVMSLIDELEYFRKKKDAVEAELEAVMDTLQLGTVLQSMLGVGSIISAAFLGEVGDITRFDNWKQVRSLAGLNLVENSSGKHKGKTKVSKRGRPYLRHMLYLAGECGCRCNPEMRQFYRYMRDRTHNPLNGHQAFVATGLKIMRILFHLAKTGEHYDPGKALGAVRLQQIASLGVA